MSVNNQRNKTIFRFSLNSKNLRTQTKGQLHLYYKITAKFLVFSHSENVSFNQLQNCEMLTFLYRDP